MSDKRPAVDELYIAALELQPEERQVFLDQVCAGHPGVKERVQQLLKAHDQVGSLLDSPAPELHPPAIEDSHKPVAKLEQTALHTTSIVQVGETIGPYKLLEEIGEGGMGSVWVAEQSKPIKRKVAIKLIKAGMDSKAVLARFGAERQALALMDHPNIARVLDGGMTEQGRPYFAMEYVKGVPLTEYCDQAKLSVKERLDLFLPICNAVQHAHQKGIIHRDLKPSNILVCLYDGKPVPKVIDFGLAKAIHQSLTEQSLYTAHGMMLGTPLYMSPEQAEHNNLDIDTRTDVYSLGVILYELLTGSTPLEKQQLKEAAFNEILRLIKEVEPQKPSTRLSGSASLPSVAARRSIEPNQLKKSLLGDLDWIVMKALDKERSHRYETANGLARDIDRFLNDEAVEACPPSSSYRLRKFIRRNRGQVIAASLVLFALLAGIAGATTGLLLANRSAEAARIAKVDAEDQKGKAILSAEREAVERKKADDAKVEAQAKEAEATILVEFFESQVFIAALPKGQNGGLGKDVKLREAITASLPVLDKHFTAQPLAEARLRLSLGNTFGYLGDFETAAAQLERARDLFLRHRGPDHPNTLGCASNLAGMYSNLGRFPEAAKLHKETLEARLGVLPPDHPDVIASKHNLAVCYEGLNRHPEALELRKEVLDARRRVLAPNHPDTLMAMNNLANSYAATGRLPEAAKLHEETLAARRKVLPKDHPDTIQSMGNLASCYADLDRPGEALKLDEEAVAALKRALPPDHPQTLHNMFNLANSYEGLNRHADALTLREETLTGQRKALPAGHPETLNTMHALAVSLIRASRGPEAILHIDECVARASGKAVDPRLIPSGINLRVTYFRKLGDPAGCRTTAEMWEKLNRTDADSLYNAACFWSVTAGVQAKTSDADAARLAQEDADRAMQWLQQAVAAGYQHAAYMKQDTDLEPLREREDFKQLLGALEKRAVTK